MSATHNRQVRINDEEWAAAQAAAAHNNETVSEVVRRSLRQYVADGRLELPADDLAALHVANDALNHLAERHLKSVSRQ